MYQATTPPCGLGGSQTESGPCVGTYTSPSDLPSIFGSLDSASVATSIVSVAAILAAVVFAVFGVRAVVAVRARKRKLKEADEKAADKHKRHWDRYQREKFKAQMRKQRAMHDGEDDSEADTEEDAQFEGEE